ncbi:MAG TPA: ATP-binding protein [Tepidisphaeraceae bacterium]|nr:ATP-binding protein [Tepidisphaeraceae bacterium]
MSGIKKERWTESEVLALPAGEHDYFDRKSGVLLRSTDFRKDVAKAISAFANSGGGHLLLGVKDDGTFDGVTAIAKGRMPTRQWMEQIVPNLVNFPLEDFRVHEVERDSPSAIPTGTVVIVIDVGDSVLAPHQTADTKQYYYREGGHSKPAPHFYLETLRNRLVSPVLKPEVADLRVVRAYPHEGGVFVEARSVFRVTNQGKTAAYKWALALEMLTFADGMRDNYYIEYRLFPKAQTSRDSYSRMDDTILPSLSLKEERDFGFVLRPRSIDKPALIDELRVALSPEVRWSFRAVSETSRGETIEQPVVRAADFEALADAILAALPRD